MSRNICFAVLLLSGGLMAQAQQLSLDEEFGGQGVVTTYCTFPHRQEEDYKEYRKKWGFMAAEKRWLLTQKPNCNWPRERIDEHLEKSKRYLEWVKRGATHWDDVLIEHLTKAYNEEVIVTTSCTGTQDRRKMGGELAITVH